VCKPIDPDIAGMSGSLTYSEVYHKYVLVDTAVNPVPGVYFSTSSNLLDWDKPKLLMKAEVPASEPDCVDPPPIHRPSLIDHSRGRDNFDTIGRTPYLYYTRENMEPDGEGGCFIDLNRDLVRVKIELDLSEPPAPPPSGGGGSGGGGGSAGDGGADDSPPDVKAAKVTISSGKKQDVDKLAITIKLDEDATIEATATVNVPGASKVYSFKRVRKQVTAGKSVKLKLKLATKNLRKVKRALRKGKKLTAKVKVVATDTDGNNSVKRTSIKLKP
jgi:hypothetical protein